MTARWSNLKLFFTLQPGQQPSYEASFQSTWFFIAFIIVGALFTLNLIVGVLIDNFNTLRKKACNMHGIDITIADSILFTLV